MCILDRPTSDSLEQVHERKCALLCIDTESAIDWSAGKAKRFALRMRMRVLLVTDLMEARYRLLYWL